MVQVESKVGLVEKARAKVNTWWRDTRRGYSDKDATLWKHYAVDPINEDEAEAYRHRWIGDILACGLTTFPNADPLMGTDPLIRSATLDLGQFIAQAPVDEIVQRMRSDARQKLDQHHLMNQSETPPHPRPSSDTLSLQS